MGVGGNSIHSKLLVAELLVEPVAKGLNFFLAAFFTIFEGADETGSDFNSVVESCRFVASLDIFEELNSCLNSVAALEDTAFKTVKTIVRNQLQHERGESNADVFFVDFV